MKFNAALVNSLGLDSASKRAWFAANVLDTACSNSPAVAISAAVAAIAARAAIVAQTAKPARPSSLPVAATANTTGFGFGEIYLNSPAYPIGTAIPAIGAKPASAAVVGAPAVIGVAAIPAISSPAIVAIPGWDMAIDCDVISATELKVTAYLPYASGSKLFGSPTSGVASIFEMTPTALDVTKWLDEKGSEGTTNFAYSTMEKFFYDAVLDLVADDPVANTIEPTIYVVAGKPITCHKILLNLVAADYDLGVDSIQLGKLV